MASTIIAAAGRHARYLSVSMSCRALGTCASQAAVTPGIPSAGAYTHNTHFTRDFTSFITLAAATSFAAAYSVSSAAEKNIASCEEASGPADAVEENDDILVVQDGMDAGTETPSSDTTSGAAPADVEEDDDDDPSKDEETSCSICLINRQGPCRKHWLKFERCMKEHSAEKEKSKAEAEDNEAENTASNEIEEDDTIMTEEDENEKHWDEFMLKSIQPGEDDDDDDDDDDEDDDEEEGEEEESNEKESGGDLEGSSEKEEMTLGERCDKFMIPWIGCIQEHRNVYSIISNDFYQKDYVDPLEDSVLESNRQQFSKSETEMEDEDDFVIKFDGVQVDLGNWREHVEADADGGEVLDADDEEPTPHGEEPQLINAYAKFKLSDPKSGAPIEVAYIKDQQGRLLGFDSFTKQKSPESEGDNDEDDKIDEGECTFHLVPGETSIITVYAIYKSLKEGADGESVREDTLYRTSEITLPGQNKS